MNIKRIIKYCLLIVFITSDQGCTKVRVINYFIPQGFEGNIAIIYSPGKTENEDVYNFHIPNDGIVYANYSFDEGNYYTHYYQRNNRDTYDTLFEDLPPYQDDSISTNRIYFPRVITFSRYKSNEEWTV